MSKINTNKNFELTNHNEDYEDKEITKDIIENYLDDTDCVDMSGGNSFDCVNCEYIDACASIANDRCNSEFVENINYGGYDTEEEFWENLLD